MILSIGVLIYFNFNTMSDSGLTLIEISQESEKHASYFSFKGLLEEIIIYGIVVLELFKEIEPKDICIYIKNLLQEIAHMIIKGQNFLKCYLQVGEPRKCAV